MARWAMQARFELFDHTADLGIRVIAPTLPELIAPAVEGLYASIGELRAKEGGAARTWVFNGRDAAGLLRDFLTELLVEFEAGQRLAKDVRTTAFNDSRLHVEAVLSPMDRERSVMLREVKAVTYHELVIRPVAGGFEATIIVDI